MTEGKASSDVVRDEDVFCDVCLDENANKEGNGNSLCMNVQIFQSHIPMRSCFRRQNVLLYK